LFLSGCRRYVVHHFRAKVMRIVREWLFLSGCRRYVVHHIEKVIEADTEQLVSIRLSPIRGSPR